MNEQAAKERAQEWLAQAEGARYELNPIEGHPTRPFYNLSPEGWIVFHVRDRQQVTVDGDRYVAVNRTTGEIRAV